MQDPFLAFMVNHWPHLVAKVGRIEGQQRILMAGVALLVTLLSGLIALVVVK